MSRDEAPELAPVAAQHAVAAIEAAPDDPDVPELTEQAVDLLRQAASRAQGLGAPREAAAHLRRALDLVGEGIEQCEIQLAMATASIDLGRYDDALAMAAEARAGFAAADDFPREAEAAAALGRGLVGGPGEFQEAADLLEPYYERLRGNPGDAVAYDAVLRAYTGALGRLGSLTYELGLETVKVAERTGDMTSVSRGVSNLAVQLLQSGHHLIGTMLLEKGVVFAREAHSPANEVHALATLSAAEYSEDVGQSLAHAQRAVEVAVRAGSLNATSLARVALAAARWATGDWDAISSPALDDFHPDDESQATAFAGLVLAARGESPSEVVGSSARREYGSHWGMVGDALVASSDGAESEELLKRAVSEVYDAGGVLDEFTSVYGAVLSLVPDGGGDAVLDHLAEVLDGSGERPMAGAQAHRDLVEALRGARRKSPEEEIARHHESAIAGYDAWGSPMFEARAQAAYGVWLSRHGRPDEAEPLLSAARTTYASLGATVWLSDLDVALSGNRVGS